MKAGAKMTIFKEKTKVKFEFDWTKERASTNG
jgi:hypothetical protein